MKKSIFNSKKTKIIIGIIVGVIALVFIICLVQKCIDFFNERKIEKDVKQKVVLINEGDLSWVYAPKVEVAPELRRIMNGEMVSVEEKEIPEQIIANTTILYNVEKIDKETYRVDFTCDGFSFEEFIAYCRDNNLTTNELMKQAFPEYIKKSKYSYHNEVSVIYKRNEGKWEGCYNDPLFLDCMSCGMVSAYKTYFDDSVNDMNSFVEKELTEEEFLEEGEDVDEKTTE